MEYKSNLNKYQVSVLREKYDFTPLYKQQRKYKIIGTLCFAAKLLIVVFSLSALIYLSGLHLSFIRYNIGSNPGVTFSPVSYTPGVKHHG